MNEWLSIGLPVESLFLTKCVEKFKSFSVQESRENFLVEMRGLKCPL